MRQHTVTIDDLLARYSEILDRGEYSRWPDLFAEECSYAIYMADDAERGLPLGYVLDDNRGRLLDRVKLIQEVWSGTIAPYRTRHIVQRTSVRSAGADMYDVRANFLVAYTQADGVAGLLASGRYEDRIGLDDSAMLFVERRVYLDGIPPRYLVYPL